MTSSETVASTAALRAGLKLGNRTDRSRPASAIRIASPPEQLSEAISPPASGPPASSSFSVSMKAPRPCTSATPSALSRAAASRSAPPSEAVWLSARPAPASERPARRATTGTPAARAVSTARAKAAMSSKPSIRSPMALTRLSAASAGITSATPTCAWLPRVTM